MEMEELTREEAIRRHRLMWNWLADETEKIGELITKKDAFKHFGWDRSKVLASCWCAASGHIGNGTWTFIFIKITSNQSAFIVRWIGQMVKRKFSKQLARRLRAMTAIRRMGYMINGVLEPIC